MTPKEDEMKVLVIGATGAVGVPLVSQLVERGHAVVGTSRTHERAETLRGLGAEPAVLDVLDREAVRRLVVETEPDAIVHEATALADGIDLKRFAETFAPTNRLRTEGTDNLIAAARAAGVERFVAQSYAAWTYAREGGPPVTEDDSPNADPPPELRRTHEAIRQLERAVIGIDGIVLRYGGFYGPGTTLDRDGEQTEAVRKRQFPAVGDGGAVWSFIHVDDAATATVAAIEHGRPGIYNVVDDDPAPVREWLPYLAEVTGAKRPRRVPPWLAKRFVGEHGVAMLTQTRGASNAKAKRELGWRPQYASWRDGFRAVLQQETPRARAA
jgi:2-alkyl-3-oxoalkanoate reductase